MAVYVCSMCVSKEKNKGVSNAIQTKTTQQPPLPQPPTPPPTQVRYLANQYAVIKGRISSYAGPTTKREQWRSL